MYNRRYYGLTYNTSHHLLRYKDITPQSSIFITSKSFNSHLFKYEPLGLKQKYKDMVNATIAFDILAAMFSDNFTTH